MTSVNPLNINADRVFIQPSSNNATIRIVSKKYRILYSLYQKRSVLEKKLIMLSALLFAICCLLIIFYIISAKVFTGRTCDEPVCVMSANRLLEGMDVSIDPCVDFYEYSCGKWAENHVTLPGESNTWFQEQSRHLTDRILGILKSPISARDDVKPVTQAKELFNMCLDSDVLDTIGLDPIYQMLSDLKLPRTIPNLQSANKFDLARTLALAQRRMSADILIALSTAIDDVTNKTIFYISPASGDSPLPDIWDDVDKNRIHASTPEQIFAERLSYVASVMSEFAPEKMNDTAISVIAFRVMMLEIRLKMDSETYPVSTDLKIKFSDLQDLMNYTKGVNESNLVFNWNDYLTVLMDGLNSTVSMNDPIIVSNPTYFYKLGKYLALNKPELFQRLIWWKIIEAMAPHTTSLMRSFKDMFNEALFQTSRPSRASTCAMAVKSFLSLALTYQISMETDYTGIFYEVTEMMADIKDTFKSFISNSWWIDKKIKEFAFYKVDGIRTFVGYPKEATDPNWISNYYKLVELSEKGYLGSILNIKARGVEYVLSFINRVPTESELKQTSWPLDPLEVNAYYSRESNNIAIPVGILQNPFYTKGLPLMNYAGIGFILGHELTHGFDNEGKDYDWKGHHRQWWNQNMADKFNEKAECFVDQYDKYDVNGTITLPENIADNGGVKQAYYAYVKYHSRKSDVTLLPGLEQFTSSQLFFIAFANVWCKKNSMFANKIAIDDHSPARYRVNGPLSNFPEFSRTWSCPRNSPMNPDKKCELW